MNGSAPAKASSIGPGPGAPWPTPAQRPEQPLTLLFLVHYPPVAGASMRGFAELLVGGMAGRGHRCRTLTAPLRLGRLARPGTGLAKWLGYIDQFLLFPHQLRRTVSQLPPDALVVVVDQALGPWIPHLGGHRHLVHVHDLLALRSSLGEFPQNRLGFSGRLYQRWIRRGFSRARHFLCVSEATRRDLQRLLPPAVLSRAQLGVLLNPLLPAFQQADPHRPRQPFLLHLGGTWYKNRLAVLAIFERLAAEPAFADLHLEIIGPPEPACEAWLQQRPTLARRIRRRQGLQTAAIIHLYETAAALLFPSIAEGFGWPVLEALACGCPVVTTRQAPMTEVAGAAATYLEPPPPGLAPDPDWVERAALQVAALLQRPPEERREARRLGLERLEAFGLDAFFERLEACYRDVVAAADRPAG
ncbi:MAG: glycosyltransferase [Synechococcaceae cyanobacterium]|nr:glycosyltransferase [Synechococcaceae cyanobacterium]